MTEKDIISFKEKIAKYDINQLKICRNELEDKLTHMILDSDLIEYIALVTAMIEQKESNNG